MNNFKYIYIYLETDIKRFLSDVSKSPLSSENTRIFFVAKFTLSNEERVKLFIYLVSSSRPLSRTTEISIIIHRSGLSELSLTINRFVNRFEAKIIGGHAIRETVRNDRGRA